MMSRRITVGHCLALLLCAGSLPAQNELDAYRYMSSTSMGTARAIGMAGACSAMGADFSSTNLNPAGLGLYRRSEVMFTPTLRLIRDEASYLDGTEVDNYTRFGFSNAGYVYSGKVAKWNDRTHMREEAERGLKSYAFSIGFNQTGQFGRNTTVSAYNRENSITEFFAAQAANYTVAQIEADNGFPGQAWWAYAIDTSGGEGTYIGAADGGDVQQALRITEYGRGNEWTIGFGANVDDKLYFGGSLGIYDLRYFQEQVYDEDDINDLHNSWANDSTPFSGLTYTSQFQTRGSGFNLRLGVIGRPTDWLRLGLSVVTPTGISSTDRYFSEVVGYLDGSSAAEKIDVPEGAFNYTLTTPFKVTAGATAILGKRGLVSADLDYIDYTTAKFKTTTDLTSSYYYSFQTENQAIRDLFGSAVNLRLGGELRFGPGRARLGFAQNGSILKQEYLRYFVYPVDPVNPIVQKLVPGRQIFAFGLGIKKESFYLDLAFTHEAWAERRLLYTVADPDAYSPELIHRNSSNNLYMTIGFTF